MTRVSTGPASTERSPERWSAVDVSSRPRLGFLYVLAIPIGAGIGAARGVEIAGFNYTGWLWLLYLAAGTLLLLADRTVGVRRKSIPFPYRLWLPWVGLVWLSLIWLEAPISVGLQDAIQITMPILSAVTASVFISTEGQVKLLMRSFFVSLVLLYLTIALARSGDFEGVDWAGALRPLGMTAAIIGGVFLAQPSRSGALRLAGWGVCLLVGIITQARIVTVSMIVLPLLNPVAKGMFKRVVLAIAMVVLGVVVFNSAAFQSRFFYSGSGTMADVAQGELDTSGRFEAWPYVWDEAWRNPILGSGVGSTHAFVSRVWNDISLVHCDYLRVFFELGLVGLGIFVLVFGWQTWALWRGTRTTSGWTRAAFGAALLGMIVFWINACTDNPLGYNLWFTDPLFALIGAAYGAAANRPPRGSAAHASFLVPQSE